MGGGRQVEEGTLSPFVLPAYLMSITTCFLLTLLPQDYRVLPSSSNLGLTVHGTWLSMKIALRMSYLIILEKHPKKSFSIF